jgi:hypothetical protein
MNIKIKIYFVQLEKLWESRSNTKGVLKLPKFPGNWVLKKMRRKRGGYESR